MNWYQLIKGNAVTIAGTLGGLSLQTFIEWAKNDENKQEVVKVIGSTGLAMLGPTGLVAGAGLGILTNLLSSCLEKRQEAQKALQTLLTNDHIATLQAKTIRSLMYDFARECKEVDGREGWSERIQLLAEDADRWWWAAVNDPLKTELDIFRERAIVEQLTKHLTGDVEPSLPSSPWRTLLLFENDKFFRNEDLPSLAIDAVADYIASKFAESWKAALKNDFSTDGRAFAAVSLHFFSEILAAVRENNEVLRTMAGSVDQIEQMVADLRRAAAALEDVDLGELNASVRQANIALSGVVEGLAALKEQVAIVGQAGRDHTTREFQDLKKEQRKEFAVLQEALQGKPPMKGREGLVGMCYDHALMQSVRSFWGRKEQLAYLNEAWSGVMDGQGNGPAVIVYHGLGGEGKSSLVGHWWHNTFLGKWRKDAFAVTWSFAAQGRTGPDVASADKFFKYAFAHFGVTELNADLKQRAVDLADHLAKQPTLLILEGLETLQESPGASQPGKLNDAVTELLRCLTGKNSVLCIVTSRSAVAGPNRFLGARVHEEKLTPLSPKEGDDLLRSIRVGERSLKGSDEMFDLIVKEFNCHALSLYLFATYSIKAYGGDLRTLDRASLSEMGSAPGGSSVKSILNAYTDWFRKGGEGAEAMLQALALVGFFDDAVPVEEMDLLLNEPAIDGLNNKLVNLPGETISMLRADLEDCGLVYRSSSDGEVKYDCHPMVRSYFREQVLKEHPAAWRSGHERLYHHHLSKAPEEKKSPVPEDLYPLYAAVNHGCAAGLHKEALNILRVRIRNGEERYSQHQLGLHGMELSALRCFFERPWEKVVSNLTAEEEIWVLSELGFSLRTQGRFEEGRGPLEKGISLYGKIGDEFKAAEWRKELAEQLLATGRVPSAVRLAAQAVLELDKNAPGATVNYSRIASRATLGMAFAAQGDFEEAMRSFSEGDALQALKDEARPRMFAMAGSRFCEFRMLPFVHRAMLYSVDPRTALTNEELSVFRKFVVDSQELMAWSSSQAKGAIGASGMLKQAIAKLGLVHKAFGLGLNGFHWSWKSPEKLLTEAMEQITRSGVREIVVPCHLAMAWSSRLNGTPTDLAVMVSHLNDAWEMASTYDLELQKADVLFDRVRLSLGLDEYPWASSSRLEDLEMAKRIVKRCGYGLRTQEIEEVEAILAGS